MNKDYNVLDALTSKTVELHRAIFDKGYEQGYEEGKGQKWTDEQLKAESKMYAKGLEDVWEAMKKIAFKETEGGIPLADLKEMFGEDSCLLTEILQNYSVTDVINTIKVYEEKQKQADDEIKVGNEVIDSGFFNSGKGIVTHVSPIMVYVLWSDGSTGRRRREDVRKTGRHIDQIAEVLEQMKGD